MKRLILFFMVMCCIALPSSAVTFGFDLFSEGSEQSKWFSALSIQEQIDALERDAHMIAQTAQEKKFSQQLSTLNTLTDETRSQLEHKGSDEFLSLKLSLYNKLYQSILETEQAYKDTEAVLEQHSKILKEIEEDPHFSKLTIERKTYYTFDELQKVGNQLQDYEDRYLSVQDKSKTLSAELVSKKKKLSVIETELKHKEKQRSELLQGFDLVFPLSFSMQQKGEIIDLQIKFLEFKKEALLIKLRELERRISKIDAEKLVLREQVALLKNEYAYVKRGVRVDEDYLKRLQLLVDKKRGDSLKKVKRFSENLQAINTLQSELRGSLKNLSEQYKISLNDLPLAGWAQEAGITATSWSGKASIMDVFEEIATYDVSKELIQAQSDLEETRFMAQEILFDIVESWYKMTVLKNAIDTDEELKLEIKKYDGPRSELQADVSSVNEKLQLATSNLTTLHNALEDIKEKKQELKKLKESLFKGKITDFDKAAQALVDTEETLRMRIDATAKLVETYSAQQNTIATTLKEIDHIVRELNLKDFWQPSSLAIDWSQEFRRIFPDIRFFLKDLKALGGSYAPSVVVETMSRKMSELVSHVWQLLLFIINFILMLVIFFLLKIYLPEFQQKLLSEGSKGIGHYRILLFFAFLIGFIEKNLLFLYSWLIIWILMQLNIIYDIYFAVLFYLGSIPLFLFVIYRFWIELASFNKRHDFVFISHQYEKRFYTVVSYLSYAAVALLLFRHAFMLLNYHQSNLPSVLMAALVIMCQIAAILLIERDQIVGLIPGKSPSGVWLRGLLDKYYYFIVLLLSAVIIMSNPYVGFFRQVSYVVSRLLFTLITIPILLRLHNFLKNRSSTIFFYMEGEAFKERFIYAKGAYGLMVIATFLLFMVIGILIISRFWDYPIRLEDLTRLLDKEIMTSPGFDPKGAPIRINAWSFLQLLGYIASGFLLVFFINHILLARLFDLLLVNVGVQNTLLILTRYFIVAIAFLIGLHSVHFGYLINYIGAALIALGFAIKDPISDVICYFVILVQRPVKIGDYIRLDDETFGVVRQITPRSVILRKYNSHTLVVPNSQFITRPIANWNYTATFIAFDDIYLLIPFSIDPKFVQTLLFGILNESPHILKSPAPIVRLDRFEQNGYQFLIRGFLSSEKTLEQWEILSDVRLNIARTLKEHGIPVAVPTRAITMISTGETSKVSSIKE